MSSETTTESPWIDCTADEYHARSELSRSQFDDYVKHGPEFYSARHILKTIRRDVTPAMRRGTIIHANVLENVPLCDLLHVWTGEVKAGTKNTTAWKDAKRLADDMGKELVTNNEFDEYFRVGDAIWKEPAANRLLKSCERREVSFAWQDDVTGLWLRARADAMSESGIIVDLKVTDLPLSAESIAKQFTLRGGNYAMQAAWYRRGFKAVTGKDCEFWFVFAQACEPYTVAVARPNDDWLLQADVELTARLQEYESRANTQNWKRAGYGQMAMIERPTYDKFSNDWE